MPAITHPVDPPAVSAAGLTSGDGVNSVGDGLVGVGVGVGDGVALVGVGEGDGLGAAYVKVIPPSTGWPSWDTTR